MFVNEACSQDIIVSEDRGLTYYQRYRTRCNSKGKVCMDFGVSVEIAEDISHQSIARQTCGKGALER